MEKAVDGAIAATLERLGPSGGAIVSWLHGDPPGHPLHVMLTDVPLGAWTTAIVLDRLSGRQAREPWAAAAKGDVAVGLAGALLAALTGLADWHRLSSADTRRIGLVHATVNTLGLLASPFLCSADARAATGVAPRWWAIPLRLPPPSSAAASFISTAQASAATPCRLPESLLPNCGFLGRQLLPPIPPPPVCFSPARPTLGPAARVRQEQSASASGGQPDTSSRR